MGLPCARLGGFVLSMLVGLSVAAKQYEVDEYSILKCCCEFLSMRHTPISLLRLDLGAMGALGAHPIPPHLSHPVWALLGRT